MANLVEIEATKKKILEERQWLQAYRNNCPEGLRAEIDAMSDKRQALLDAIDAEVLKIDIQIPEGAEAYLIK